MLFKYVPEELEGQHGVSKWYTVQRNPENIKPYIKIRPSQINDCVEVKAV